MNRGGDCVQVAGNRYVAYADQTIYEFYWETRDDRPRPAYCHPDDDNAFSPDDYAKRTANLRGADFSESDTTLAGVPGKMFRREAGSYIETKWLTWLDNSVVEMTVIRRKNISPAGESRFADSLGINAATALEIGEGSKASAVDAGTSSPPAATREPVTDPIVFWYKPRPGYTESARTKSVTGSVVLKVTFLANGTVGDVTPVKGLEEGLTDLTVAAARRAVFLPARSNGVPVTVTKQLEYHFSIY